MPSMTDAVNRFFDSRLRTQSTATIASGQTNSSVINLQDTALLGFQVPAGWTGSIKLQASLDGSTFADIYGSDGAQVGLIASPVAGAFYAVDVAALLPWPFVRFVDGTAPGSNLSIPVITRPLA